MDEMAFEIEALAGQEMLAPMVGMVLPSSVEAGVLRSIGDCSMPSWHDLKSGDSSPQWLGPASPA
jgi:hypothetical protein